MSEYKLAAEPRQGTGKGAARRTRAQGRVPAVLYGHGMQPQHLSIDARDFTFALRTDAGTNVLLDLDVAGDRHLVLAKDIQRHPVKGGFTHIDFIAVQRGEKVTVQVPVHLTGTAAGVTEGGVLNQDATQLTVEAEVTHVPESVELDVTGLNIGDVLRVGDIPVSSGVAILDDADTVVVSMAAPSVAPEPDAEATPAEGEAAPAADAE